jgi:hypothetical protein
VARVEIPTVAFTRGGTTMPTAIPGDVTNGHTLPNDGRVGLIIDNTDAAVAHNVTINLARTVDGQSVVPRTESVPANTSKAFGPFSAADYGSDLSVDVDNASLTLIAVRVI